MRLTITFFLGALLLISGGLTLGFLSLDLAAPEENQLVASGALAWWGEGTGWSSQEELYEAESTGWSSYEENYPDPQSTGWSSFEEQYGPQGTGWSSYEERYAPEGTGWSSYEEQPEPESTGWSSFEDQYGEYEGPESTGWSSYEETYGAYSEPESSWWDADDSEPRVGRESGWDEPRYAGSDGGDDAVMYDEWTDAASADGAWSQSQGVSVQDPWYVRSFPGFGQVVQQIVPGLQVSAPQPSPQPIVRPVYPPAPPQYPQPSCWITSRPQSVASGGSSILEWQTFNATRANLSGVGQVPASGSRRISSITSTKAYALNVSGPGGSGSCHTEIRVEAAAAPSCMIAVHPTRISRGDSANLAWGSQNASSASLTGVGAVAVSGGRYVSPSNSTTYTLTVKGAGGRTNTCSARLTVVP